MRFSVYGGDAKEVGKGLRSAAGYIRRELAARLNLRLTPELTFLSDNSLEHGAHISALIDSLRKESLEKKEKEVQGKKESET